MTAVTDAGAPLLRADLIATAVDGGDGAVTAGARIRLAASTCPSCGRVHFPAREQCPACGAATRATPLQSGAILGACTAVLHPPPGALVEVPYLIGVAQFPEGISIMGVVVGASETPPPGTPVDTVATALPDGRLTYAYQPSQPHR
jgi:uncharacterized OB-fold protein